jgi:hypothetical protein
LSAFVVSKQDIDILVTAIAGLPGGAIVNPDELGRLLWRENVASVDYRYNLAKRRPLELAGYNLAVETYTHQPLAAWPAAVARIAACYDYQSCEHDGYQASEARQFYLRIAAAFPETLPGYDDMPWGISGAADLAKACPPNICPPDGQDG